MKIRVGDFIKNEVIRSGKQKKQIAIDVGLSRNQLNNILAEPDMEIKYITKIGKSIKHDFTKDIPQLSSFVTEDVNVEYESLSVIQLKDELLDIHRKFSALQTEYIGTLKELLDCRREMSLK